MYALHKVEIACTGIVISPENTGKVQIWSRFDDFKQSCNLGI